MIVVCEPQCTGFAHESHNAGMLLMLTLAYPNEQITFFAERTHIEAVCYCFTASGHSTSQITFIPVELPPVSSSFWSFYRDFRFIDSILVRAEALQAKNVFFLSIHSNSLLALKLLQKKKFSNLNSFALLHGVMEYARHPFYWCLLKSRHIRWIQHFRYILKYIKLDSLKYIALSPFCYQRIKGNNFFSSLPLKQLYLPIIFDNKSNIFKNKKITFATVGGGNPYKVAELDSLLMQKGYSEYQILVLGNFPSQLNHSNHLFPLQKAGPLSRESISCFMRNVDILLLFYNKDSYSYTQSGSFYEIFQYNKPAIFFRNDNFSWHNSICGPVGKEVDSLSAMVHEIGAILAKDANIINNYIRYKKNIAGARSFMDNFNKTCLQRLNLD